MINYDIYPKPNSKLMEKFFALILTGLTLIACSTGTNKRVNENSKTNKTENILKTDPPNLLKTNLKIVELKFIHSFLDEKGEILGKLFGKSINDTLYSDFLIVKEINNTPTPIYSIERTIFQNINGIENLPINSEQFYGYKVLVMVKDDMDIEPLFKINDKILKGDPITILWDKSKKVFNVLITP
jgi:hypothetical protein